MPVLADGERRRPRRRRRGPAPPRAPARARAAAPARSGTPPNRANAAAGVLATLDRRLSLAIVAQPAGLEERGQRDRRERRLEVGLVGGPAGTARWRSRARARADFSRMRSCAIATAAAPGRTGTDRASRSSASAGTFSNSVVTAAHVGGECDRARPGRRRRRARWQSATGPAGTARVGIEHHDAVAHGPRPQGEHAAELAAAEHAERWRPAGSRGLPGKLEVEDALRSGRARNCSSRAREPRVLQREDGDGGERRVLRAGRADGERRHRDPGRHLDDREQRVESLEVPARHRHAQHRQRWSWRRACPAGARRRPRRR